MLNYKSLMTDNDLRLTKLGIKVSYKRLESVFNRVMNEWGHLGKKVSDYLVDQATKGYNYIIVNEQFLEAFNLSSIPMAITTLKEGRFLYANNGLLATTGYNREEIVGSTLTELGFMSKEDQRNALLEFKRKGKFIDLGFKSRSKDGEILDLSWSADLLIIGDIKCLISIFADNTQRNLAEKKVKQYNERLSILLDLNRAILELNSPEKIAKAALDQIIKLVPCQCLSVTLLDCERREVEFIAVKTQKGLKFRTAHRIPIAPYEEHIKFIKSNRAMVFEEMSKNSLQAGALKKLYEGGMRSSVFVPLIFRGELIGTLNLHADRPRFFTREHIDIAKDVAGSLAIAIQQSILYEKLSIGQRRLDALSRKLVETQEKERYHIAQEVLHDGIGQELTVLKMDLYNIKRLYNKSEMKKRLDGSLKILEKINKEIHDLAIDLRPPIIEDFGLVPTLEWLLTRYKERTDLKVEFRAEPFKEPMLKDLQTTCFRVAQEALTNIVRHSKAKKIKVELIRQNGDLVLKVIDDGVGFNLKKILEQSGQNNNLGLVGMKERVRLIGGKLEIKSSPRQGTYIEARFPLDYRN